VGADKGARAHECKPRIKAHRTPDEVADGLRPYEGILGNIEALKTRRQRTIGRTLSLCLEEEIVLKCQHVKIQPAPQRDHRTSLKIEPGTLRCVMYIFRACALRTSALSRSICILTFFLFY
jgi:hypothetical protein